MDDTLRGLRALVTGGASGIGAATARELTHRGAAVAVLDREISGVPDGLLPVQCDLADADGVHDAVVWVARELGGIDVVVNNAGIGVSGDVTQNDDDEWHRVLDINVVGIARVMRAALPHLRRSPSAAVVNTCSAVAYVGVRSRALYSASKGAVHGLTLAMAADHVGEGIRVNAVAPGTVETPWVGRLLDAAEDREAAAEALRRRQPLGRLVTAEEVAAAVVALASPSAGSITGTVVHVDGGMTSLRL
jgi:NAD(P)-dependent dehydrogenase (short-subunit alcohol dehydrogenase family)